MKPESPDFSFKLSRRELLKLGGIGFGTILLGSCSKPPEPLPTASPRPTARPTPEARPTPVPTRAPTLTRVPTQTRIPEPTPTPEPPKLLERIKVDIPGLTVERYAAKFQDITDEVPESYAQKLREWFEQPEYFQERTLLNPSIRWSDVHKQRGPSIIGIDEIRPGHGAEYFYFNSDEGRFYTDILPPLPQDTQERTQDNPWGDGWRTVGEDEKRILGWKIATVTIPDYNIHLADNLTYDGKILYSASGYIDTIEYGEDRWVRIIADIPNATKTIITNRDQRDFKGQLSERGNKLLLSFPDKTPNKTDPQRGTYLVDLDNWQVRFSLDKPSKTIFLNEDGSRLYQLSESPSVGYLYNTITKERRAVSWPPHLASYDHIASRNLQFIERRLGMFESSRTVEGQWGGIVYDNSTGIFYEVSARGWSLIAQKIYNDGTIYTNRGDILTFTGKGYELLRAGEGGSKHIYNQPRIW